MSEDQSKEFVDSYSAFRRMEILYECLKLLNYEKEFVRKQKHKAITRHYFAISNNPGEQFHVFSLLAHWLITKLHGDFDQPQEYDDPNVVIVNILDFVRKVDPVIDVVPAKLKSGAGEGCIDVLLVLAEYSLSQSKPTLSLPKYPDESKSNHGYEVVDLESEQNINKEISEWIVDLKILAGGSSLSNKQTCDTDFIDESLEGSEVYEEEDMFNPKDSGRKSISGKSSTSPASEMMLLPESLIKPQEMATNVTEKGILHPPKDSSQWLLELERVIPQLKVSANPSDTKDWRYNLDLMKKYKKEMSKVYAESQQPLHKIKDDLIRSIDKIKIKEKHLNMQLGPELHAYRDAQDEVEAVQKRYDEWKDKVKELTRELMAITDELGQVKQEIEERGTSMTDGSPVDRVKQAIRKLKNELTEMDIHKGVLEHMILRAVSQSSGIALKAGDDDSGSQINFEFS
ncbi:Intraflagellar transport protein 57 [Cichlidogyrus casuarinus]|uniref:Intraflagellar transport protein 57 n=1 Tax=Cichlidogyrus casuarinus TaxID=1844966 RepID=A0ABD2Q727_9PLAT